MRPRALLLGRAHPQLSACSLPPPPTDAALDLPAQTTRPPRAPGPSTTGVLLVRFSAAGQRCRPTWALPPVPTPGREVHGQVRPCETHGDGQAACASSSSSLLAARCTPPGLRSLQLTPPLRPAHRVEQRHQELGTRRGARRAALVHAHVHRPDLPDRRAHLLREAQALYPVRALPRPGKHTNKLKVDHRKNAADILVTAEPEGPALKYIMHGGPLLRRQQELVEWVRRGGAPLGR